MNKQYFALKEPARAQKADSLAPFLPQKNQRLRGALITPAPKKKKKEIQAERCIVA